MTDVDDTDGSCRSCGGRWFRLDPAEPGVPVGITLSGGGAPTGYCGVPICVDCGSTWDTARPHLSVVDP